MKCCDKCDKTDRDTKIFDWYIDAECRGAGVRYQNSEFKHRFDLCKECSEAAADALRDHLDGYFFSAPPLDRPDESGDT